MYYQAPPENLSINGSEPQSDEEPIIICPAVSLENTSYAVLAPNMDSLQVNLARDSSYCNISPRVNHSYIDVAPVFQIRRHEDIGERKVEFSYYIMTPDGRKGVFEEAIYIPKRKKEIYYTGKSIRIPIPEKEKYYYPITMGLIINPEELDHNNKYFNAHYEE